MKKLLLTMLLICIGLSAKAQITATFDDEPGKVFDELPASMYFTLSEPMTGESPKYTIKSGTQEMTRSCTRVTAGDYEHFYFWLSYYVQGDLLAAIQETGEFTITLTLNDGTVLEPVAYKLKKPITATFDDEPGKVFDELPASMYFTLSEPMTGESPKYTIKSGTQEMTRSCTRVTAGDYEHFYFWLSYYVKDELLAAIQETGEFTITLTLNDGTVLEPVAYGLKKNEPVVTVAFAQTPGTIFAGIPAEIAFTLSADAENAPAVKINEKYDIACVAVGESATEFVVRTADLTEETLDDIASTGVLTVAVRPEGMEEPAGSATFYVVPAEISWTPAPGYESGTVFTSRPEKLTYTLTDALPAEGVFDSGIILSASVPEDFQTWDISLPCTVEGKEVTFDLQQLSADDIKRIEDNENFIVALRLTSKMLHAEYVLNVRKKPVTLGYCNDEFDSPMQLLGSEGAATTVGGAIRIPAAKLESLKGGTISKVRIGIGEGLERVYAWIRPSLSEPAIVMKKLEDTSEGWHEIVFDEPYVITGEELFIGYSGHQPVGVKAIRSGGPDRPDACWLGIKSNWEDCSNKGYGALYIQAIGEAVLPVADLGVDNLQLDKDYYKSGDKVKANFTVVNSGANTINHYLVTLYFDGSESTPIVVDEPIASDSRKNFNVELDLKDYTDGIYPLTVGCSINEEGRTDQIAENNEATADVAVYSTDYPRTVLLEQFTTINCVNCPNGSAALKAAVADRTDVAWLAHHVGYGTDEFTVEESTPLLDLGVAGAPSLMTDRTMVTGSVPPFGIGYSNPTEGAKVIGSYIDACAAVPAFAGLSIEQKFNTEKEVLEITVKGEKNAIFNLFNPACNYTVYLTEDNLMASRPQQGADINYVHNHVVRKVLTPAFGTPVTWNDDTFSATFETALDEKWNTGNMHIVAVLNKPFAQADVTNAQVLNSAVVAVNAPQTGIDELDTDGVLYLGADGSIHGEGFERIEVYSTAGIRLTNTRLHKGIYVVRAVKVNGETVVRKTLVK